MPSSSGSAVYRAQNSLAVPPIGHLRASDSNWVALMPLLPQTQTCVFDSYWKFAAERLAMYERRLGGKASPWTDDPVLRSFRFTNTYRAADRVSQYLIAEVQYGEGRSQNPAELFFRTLLFKLFNKIETWQRLERELGPLSWQSADFDSISRILSGAIARGERIYSAAYIMPAPRYGHERKHDNHLALLREMMLCGLPAHVERASSLSEVYDLIKPYPGLGPFLAFQYSIDLNYSAMLSFSESDFVVAGPGALDGISKCFSNTEDFRPEDIIYCMADMQEGEFRRLGLDFKGLFGRPLMPIDCQNLFCEISKYARVAHPEVAGIANRTRIKQSYEAPRAHLPRPTFPPRWNLTVPNYSAYQPTSQQLRLL